MQTGASDYAVLVVGRTLGGVGIGTLACVAPIYIRCVPVFPCPSPAPR